MGQKGKDQPTSQKKSLKLWSSPKPPARDPSVPFSLPTTSKTHQSQITEEEEVPFRKRCCKYLYDRDKKTFCGRTCKNWACIIGYSIMYILFLATYTMVFLYGSLMIMKSTVDYTEIDKVLMMTYSERGIGITATPTSENMYPIIWYRRGERSEYDKYINALNRLLLVSRKRINPNNLGPCGEEPYGYDDTPCVLLKINRQWKWSAKPLQMNSTKINNIPIQVKEWLQMDSNKLWFHCRGYHSYDAEHIGRFSYYPYPPGIDPDRFPLDRDDMSPLIAVQISNFTLGVSLAVECKLWYESGPSSVEFVLYVANSFSDNK